MLEREKERAIRREVVAAVKRAQELRSDFLGLGDRLYRERPDVWMEVKDSWNTRWFPHVEVDVKVTCRLKRTGATADPVRIR